VGNENCRVPEDRLRQKRFGVVVYTPFNRLGEHQVAKTISKRKEYTKDDLKLLKAHSKARTPVTKVSKLMKRSEGSLRQKARAMGIGLGHQR
jgi:hypothetical protein